MESDAHQGVLGSSVRYKDLLSSDSPEHTSRRILRKDGPIYDELRAVGDRNQRPTGLIERRVQYSSRKEGIAVGIEADSDTDVFIEGMFASSSLGYSPQGPECPSTVQDGDSVTSKEALDETSQKHASESSDVYFDNARAPVAEPSVAQETTAGEGSNETMRGEEYLQGEDHIASSEQFQTTDDKHTCTEHEQRVEEDSKDEVRHDSVSLTMSPSFDTTLWKSNEGSHVTAIYLTQDSSKTRKDSLQTRARKKSKSLEDIRPEAEKSRTLSDSFSDPDLTHCHCVGSPARSKRNTNSATKKRFKFVSFCKKHRKAKAKPAALKDEAFKASSLKVCVLKDEIQDEKLCEWVEASPVAIETKPFTVRL